MGKVVDIDSQPRRAALAQTALEDRPGPRRRRLHRRRLRDRRPARPRPARRQQHRQRLRHLRRHQRRLLRRRHARQRGHPRRDDAGAQRAGPVRARGPRPRQGAEAQLPRLPAEGGRAAAAQPRAAAGAGQGRRALGDRHRRRPRRERCPNGLYSGAGIDDYVEEVLADGGRANDFRLLDRELYITATDLDTTERIVFGEEDWADVPISKAIECSTALPIVYKPVELKGRQLVDGGIRSTTNVDIAVERGAKFIVVVNPIVPYVNDFEKTIPTMTRHPGAAGLRHGHAGDRQPGLPDHLPRPPAPGGRAVAGEVPGGRHRPGRAGARRRADVRHADHGLLAAPADRPPRLRIGDRDAGARTTSASRRSPNATASRSPAAASDASSSAPPRKSPSRPRPGGGCSSRRPRCCCASPARRPSLEARGGEGGGRLRREFDRRLAPAPAHRAADDRRATMVRSANCFGSHRRRRLASASELYPGR